MFSKYVVYFVIGNLIDRQIGTHKCGESAGRCPGVRDVDQGDSQVYPLQLHLILLGSSTISAHAADIGNDMNSLCIRMIDLVLVVHRSSTIFSCGLPNALGTPSEGSRV